MKIYQKIKLLFVKKNTPYLSSYLGWYNNTNYLTLLSRDGKFNNLLATKRGL